MRKIFLILILVILVSPFPVRAEEDNVKIIKILLEPGHDNQYFGTKFKNVKETEINLELASKISKILSKNKSFQVFMTRDKNGYLSDITNYFENKKDEIINFKKEAKAETAIKIANGDFIVKEGAPHHSVNSEIAFRLYGLNKWADENNMDAVINIHFNDYPRRYEKKAGKYKGFTIYIPESPLINSKKSYDLGKNIFLELIKKYKTSTYPAEKDGLVPDQKLIALGTNDTLKTRSVLIEYAYIYEKILSTKKTREKTLQSMADLTAKGIENYFSKNQNQ